MKKEIINIDNEFEENEIVFEEEKDSKKKKIISIIIIILILIGSIVAYSRYIGVSGLIIKENKIEDKNLPESFNGLKIIQFSDIHYGTTTSIENIKNIVKEINNQKADIVVFTGDLFDNDIKINENDINILKEELSKIKSSIDKYAVKGDQDYTNKTDFESIFKYADFQILNNSNTLIYYKDTTPIKLVGIESNIQKKNDIDTATLIENDENEYFTILLSHEPSIINNLNNNNNINVILSSHTLGGLIRLPFAGGMIKQKYSENYNDEYYKENNIQMYISSGIGTHNYNFRLFNRPSINLYRLYKKN